MTGRRASVVGRVFQLNVSNGGVPKRRVESATVTYRGLSGDRQADLRAHGSPQQALCLFGIEQIAVLRAEGHRVFAGATGENITLEGIDWTFLTPGTRLALGPGAVVEITDYASPCWKNAAWFTNGNFHRIDQSFFPQSSRVYARVLQTGDIADGDRVSVTLEDAIDRVPRRQAHPIRWPADFQ
jgi:MOSC domain-containing protein YiiM